MPGDEMDLPEMDKDDPCYMEWGEEESYVLISREEEEKRKAAKMGISTAAHVHGVTPDVVVGSPPRFSYDPAKARQKPTVSLSLFKKKIVSIIEEYFESGDIDEVGRSLSEINSKVFHYEFVKRAMTMAMDRHNSTRESVSQLISGLYPKILSTNQIGKGFERVFEQVESLALDIPGASGLLTKFLARAVVDEVLPPSFLNDEVVMSLGGDVVKAAKVMLSAPHGIARIERVWGPGDGRSATELKDVIKQILAEYLLSEDKAEAGNCVQELDAEFFHHEVVKRAVVIAMDGGVARQRSVSSLLAYLVNQQIMSVAQVKKGFDRLIEVLRDLTLDVPAAPRILQTFIRKAIADKCLPADFHSNADAPKAPKSPAKPIPAKVAIPSQPGDSEMNRLLAIGARALKNQRASPKKL